MIDFKYHAFCYRRIRSENDEVFAAMVCLHDVMVSPQCVLAQPAHLACACLVVATFMRVVCNEGNYVDDASRLFTICSDISRQCNVSVNGVQDLVSSVVDVHSRCISRCNV